MFLVDTNVLSLGAPDRSSSPEVLVEWMRAHSKNLFMSTVSVTEISVGIAKLERIGAMSRAGHLGKWLDLVIHLYGDRMLPFDVPVARLAGKLLEQGRATGYSPGFADAAIAATAGSYGLTVLTRNLRHFIPFGIDVLDPLDTLPWLSDRSRNEI